MPYSLLYFSSMIVIKDSEITQQIGNQSDFSVQADTGRGEIAAEQNASGNITGRVNQIGSPVTKDHTIVRIHEENHQVVLGDGATSPLVRENVYMPRTLKGGESGDGGDAIHADSQGNGVGDVDVSPGNGDVAAGTEIVLLDRDRVADLATNGERVEKALAESDRQPNDGTPVYENIGLIIRGASLPPDADEGESPDPGTATEDQSTPAKPGVNDSGRGGRIPPVDPPRAGGEEDPNERPEGEEPEIHPRTRDAQAQRQRDLARLGQVRPIERDGDRLPEQIAVQLAEKITSGDLAAGRKMPATGAIAEAFGVGTRTVQEANKLLAERGQLVLGRRFNVAGPPSEEAEMFSQLTPRAAEIYEELESRIATGTYAQGERLPASEDLAVELEAYRETVTEAMHLLDRRRVIVDRGAQGRYLTPAEGEPQRLPAATTASPERDSAIAYIRTLSTDEPMPSQKELVAVTGLDQNVIRLAVRDLVRLGEIEQTGRGQSPIYRGQREALGTVTKIPQREPGVSPISVERGRKGFAQSETAVASTMEVYETELQAWRANNPGPRLDAPLETLIPPEILVATVDPTKIRMRVGEQSEDHTEFMVTVDVSPDRVTDPVLLLTAKRAGEKMPQNVDPMAWHRSQMVERGALGESDVGLMYVSLRREIDDTNAESVLVIDTLYPRPALRNQDKLGSNIIDSTTDKIVAFAQDQGFSYVVGWSVSGELQLADLPEGLRNKVTVDYIGRLEKLKVIKTPPPAEVSGDDIVSDITQDEEHREVALTPGREVTLAQPSETNGVSIPFEEASGGIDRRELAEKVVERANYLAGHTKEYNPRLHPVLTPLQMTLIFLALKEEEVLTAGQPPGQKGEGDMQRLKNVVYDEMFLSEMKPRQLDQWANVLAKSGNIKDLIAACHYKMVYSMALSVTSEEPSPETEETATKLGLHDAINAGNNGLAVAIDQYDVTRGVKFSSYAFAQIRLEMLQSLQAVTGIERRLVFDGLGRIGRIVGAYKEIFKEDQAMAQRDLNMTQDGPLRDEIDLALRYAFPDMSDNLRRDTLDAYYNPKEIQSLDQTVGEDGETTLGEMLEGAPVVATIAVEQPISSRLESVISNLGPLQAELVLTKASVNSEAEVERIAEQYGIDITRAKTLQMQALMSLRDDPNFLARLQSQRSSVIPEEDEGTQSVKVSAEAAEISTTAARADTQEFDSRVAVFLGQNLKYADIVANLSNERDEVVSTQRVKRAVYRIRKAQSGDEIQKPGAQAPAREHRRTRQLREDRKAEAETPQTRAIEAYMEQHRPRILGREVHRGPQAATREFDSQVSALLDQNLTKEQIIANLSTPGEQVSQIKVSRSISRIRDAIVQQRRAQDQVQREPEE